MFYQNKFFGAERALARTFPKHKEGKADFVFKMSIALKEANETDYWLRLLHASEYLNATEFESISKDVNELISMLVSICKTSKLNQ